MSLSVWNIYCGFLFPVQNLVTHPKGEARVPGFASHTNTTDTIGERKFLLGEQHRTNQVPKYEMILPGKPVTMDHLEQVDLEPRLAVWIIIFNPSDHDTWCQHRPIVRHAATEKWGMKSHQVVRILPSTLCWQDASLIKQMCRRPRPLAINQVLTAQAVKNARDLGLIPGLGKCPGEMNGYPLQYSCLEHSRLVGYSPWSYMDWAKSHTWLSDFHSLTHSAKIIGTKSNEWRRMLYGPQESHSQEMEKTNKLLELKNHLDL